MTIQEAMKSGKLFKRPCHIYPMKVVGRWIVCWDEEENGIVLPDGEYKPDLEDILATDWETKQ